MPIFLNAIQNPNSSLPVFLLDFSGEISQDAFDDWLIAMSDLLASEQSFALIYHSRTGLTLPDNYRQIEAVWYKTHKESFFKYCKGLVRIVDDETQRQALDSPAFHKAWRVPYVVVLSLTEAKAWINTKIGAV
ncbi:MULTISPECIES: hypothetical protein [Pseudomonadota]|uniref:hypothetical protein n=1 Tax=Pseudomonadota TaxID=1224 RepID=UPI0018CBCD54|nr:MULTISPECIES: hypothetical protein [Pseudomonadota]MBG9088289.1 hypothetical protein [Neisseria meningitidis]MCG7412210.1 hypothetical protein [Moraxella nonliquefaciens]